MTKTIYKIRRKNDGLFSLKGGGKWDFGEKGHEWVKLNHLKCHITNCRDKYSNLDNFEVVTEKYELSSTNTIELKEFN